MRLKFDNNNKKYKDEESKNSNQHEKKYKNMSYWIFAGLRIVLTLIPQTGYIHPDEYFQSIEVIAGNVISSWNITKLILIVFFFVSQGIVLILMLINPGNLMQHFPCDQA